MTKKNLSKTAIAIIVLIVAGVVFGSKYLQPSGKMSLFSVSQVEIEPEGGTVIDDKLRGCYWVVMLSVDEIDALEGRVTVIEEGQTGEFNGKTVETRKSLEIGINPEQAFFYRGVRQETTTITEDAYKSVHNKVTGQVWFDKSSHVAPLMSNHYVWDESFWKAETTFKVQAWLNDVLITPYGGKVMDTHAGETEFTIDTSYGQIAFRSLGGLTGGWEEPDVGDLLIWNENYVYDWDQAYYAIEYDSGGQQVNWKATDTKVQKLVDHNNPYSVYWFGAMRWSEKSTVISDNEVRRTPAGFREPKTGEYVLWGLNSADYGGWTSQDDTLNERRIPVKPMIFPDAKTTDEYSVTEWLEYVKNIPNRGKLGNVEDRVFRGYDSWKLDSVNDQVRVYMPYNAYEVPMVQILVPVELVDTWVWKPAVANLKVEEVGWVGATGNSIEIAAGAVRTCWAKIRQDSTVEAMGKVVASSSVSHASVHPDFEKPTLAPGDVTTLYFEVTNLGVTTDTTGRVQFSCRELLTNSQTDFNNELTFTLKHAGAGGNTILDITTVDGETGLPVGGIWVYLSYGGNVLEKINDENGYTSFNLGSYTGKVVVTTGETQVYKKAIRSLDLKSGTTNLVIHLLKEDEQIPWEYIIIGGIIAVSAAVAYAMTQRRPRRRKRRS